MILPLNSQYPHLSHWIHTVSLFNNIFRSVFTLCTPLYTSTLSDIGISELDVYEALSTLDTSKAMGIDGIGPKILEQCALALYNPLHHPFLLSLSQHSLNSHRLAWAPDYSSSQVWRQVIRAKLSSYYLFFALSPKSWKS